MKTITEAGPVDIIDKIEEEEIHILEKVTETRRALVWLKRAVIILMLVAIALVIGNFLGLWIASKMGM